MREGFYRRRGKRWLDAAAALVLMGALAPLFLLVAAAVRAALGAPVLFRQVRPGHRGVPFTLVKFRTMRDARDAAGRLLPDEQRLTRLGLLLRRFSLDELPELWNVLRGDMSLVGPRPLLMEYLGRYSPLQERRHEVRPGITGWAQVNGRNALDWERRFEHDVWYVDHHGVALDLRILLVTIWTVARGRGAGAAGQADIPLFLGTPRPGEAGADETHPPSAHGASRPSDCSDGLLRTELRS